MLGYPHSCILGALPLGWDPLMWKCHQRAVLGGSSAVLQCLPTAGQDCRGLWGMDLLGSVWSVAFLMPGTTTAEQKLLFLSLIYQRERFPH